MVSKTIDSYIYRLLSSIYIWKNIVIKCVKKGLYSFTYKIVFKSIY